MTKAGTDNQPVNSVRWVPRDHLSRNAWNPNIQQTPEFELLRRSLIENGWTQPIVVTEDYEIVDGFHRWKLSEEADIHNLTNGYVPVVVIAGDKNTLMASTVRHNRARGTHAVLRMADIVRDMLDNGYTREDVMREMGMEGEEVDRLADQSGMTVNGSNGEFGKAWIPDGSRA